MNRNRNYILPLGILFPFLIFSSEIKEKSSIQLSTFGGIESVLLKWDLPDERDIVNISIYRSDDMMTSFELIQLDGAITDRYLDVDIAFDELLFYKLEIKMIDGIIYKSSQKTPSVVRTKSAERYNSQLESLKIKYPVLFNSGNHLSHINELKSLILHDFLNRVIPVHIENAYGLIMYLLMENLEASSFLNFLSIQDVKALEYLFSENGQEELVLHFNEAFNDLEVLYRNSVLLTKNEWQLERERTIAKLNEKFSLGNKMYQDDIIFMESISPVRITGIKKDSSGVAISLFKKNADFLQFQLFSDGELIPVDPANSFICEVSVPDDVSKIDLIINDQKIQSILSLNEFGSMNISLDDQYVFNDIFNELRIMRSIPYQQHQLNEIAFDPVKKLLRVEIASLSEDTEKLGLFIDEKLLWEWVDYSSFEMSFVDSNWVLDGVTSHTWLHLCIGNDDGDWDIIESRPIDHKKTIHESKVPDMGRWTTISFSSFGESNDITQAEKTNQIIPEIFALYQNYPNPFNNSTKISFDLLEESTVSLYVADARGRKLHVFLEEIYLETGSYSFD